MNGSILKSWGSDSNISSMIEMGIQLMDITVDSFTQNCFNNILADRHCAILKSESWKDNNSWSYLIPIMAKVAHNRLKVPQKDIKEVGNPDGPLAIILTQNKLTTVEIKDQLMHLFFKVNYSNRNGRQSLYAVHCHQNFITQKRWSGVDILVTTPPCFFQLLRERAPYVEFNRLEYLVIEECDVVLEKEEPFGEIIEFVRDSIARLGHRRLGCGLKVIFSGQKMTVQLDQIIDDYVTDAVVIR